MRAWHTATFQGYPWADGSVGMRNYWLVVPVVFCENRNIRLMQDAFERDLGYGKIDCYRQQVQQLADAYRAGRLDEPDAAAVVNAEQPVSRSALFPNADSHQVFDPRNGLWRHRGRCPAPVAMCWRASLPIPTWGRNRIKPCRLGKARPSLPRGRSYRMDDCFLLKALADRGA